MKIKKIFFCLSSLIVLNGCIETTAFIGPAISVGKTGNVYQASISYATNQVLYNTTGKTSIEHMTSFLDPNDDYDGNLNTIIMQKLNDANKSIKPEKKISLKKKEPELVLELNSEDQFILF